MKLPDWPIGLSVIDGKGIGENGDPNGAMIVTPPPEEALRRFRERDMPFTSRRIARLEPSHYITHEQCVAFGALFAAAPDLLTALQSFVDYYEQAGIGPCLEADDDTDDGTSFDGDERFNVRLARAAIAKAVGA